MNLLLLALFGLGGAGLFLLWSAGRGPRSPEERSAQSRAASACLPELAEPALPARREATQWSAAPRARDSDDAEPARAVRASGARSEREFLAQFLALEHAQPGTLAAQASARLDGPGTLAEKVAWLRALEVCGVATSADWHEHAVRAAPLEDAADLADYALAALGRAAQAEPRASSALARLAFERPSPALALRRAAVALFAASCDERGLERLAPELARESDELFVAGALAALEPRSPSPALVRLLAAHPRASSAVAGAEARAEE